MKNCPLNGHNFIAADNILVKYCPGQNFIIKFNEILSMDDISYEILSHGHYFIEDNILWYKYTSALKNIACLVNSTLPKF